MAGGALGGDDEEIISNINVTPLVDVVLVLLIVLMVTATAIVSKAISVELPQAATGEQAPADLAVSVDEDGTLYFNETEVEEAQLREEIRRVKAANPEVRAVIAADGRLAHASVVRVIDVLRQEGVTKFAINVRPQDLAGP